ncbi:family 4 glycosyl hydrolase [Wenjunlia tyrosinilytica]|uniref:6-phospho-beta-glucosidase n=1 Tax=Wenjunlia tyrosinilytica TaxID=1544741 RepID=A0A917ZTC6_9ACTN|nr:6-phospho-beta-glucosidase [Wenjunlia tyrosinilytica]GGO91690.1 6-phospho-beta-glucosidase [Wenjunlia tyrosinilytica]
MKLAVVGGGSTYTPELVDGFARLHEILPLDELVLIDPDAERLRLIGDFASRIFARQGLSATITTTGDLDSGIDGAAAVLLQLRIGGQAARHTDETIPLQCGCVGQETTGAGGLAKALRTVPTVLRIADRVAELAPEAWIVDFTNPVGIVTRALLDAGHRAVGLCNVARGLQHTIGDWYGVDADRIVLDHAGLNHLTWMRGARLDGVDLLPEILERHGDALARRSRLPVDTLRRLGVVPSYYLTYYYGHDEVVAEQRGGQSRAHQVAAIEQDLLRMYADPALDEKPALLEERGGAYYSEAAVNLLAALLGRRGDKPDIPQVANVRNNGTLPFLPDEAVVEVPALIGPDGANPLEVPPLAPLYAGLVAHVAAYEELALEAAVHGGVHRVEDALLAHPLVGQAHQARTLAAELVAANRAFLPWARA